MKLVGIFDGLKLTMMSERRGEREKNIQSGELTKHQNSSFIMLVLPEWPVGILFLISLIRGCSQFSPP